MIFIFDSKGTSLYVQHEPIFQGSNNANTVMVIAPFARNVQATVSFDLPNGIKTQPRRMNSVQISTKEFYDAELNAYNTWEASVDYPVTEYTGDVGVHFDFYLGHNQKLATYQSAFLVLSGGSNPPPDIPDNDTIYDDILHYLTSISVGFDKAYEYIRYVAPNKYLINNNEIALGLQYVNGDSGVSGKFDVLGSTSNLSESAILNPNTVGDYFYRNESAVSGDKGFEFDFFSPREIGLVQAYLFNYTTSLKLCMYYWDGMNNDWKLAESITIPAISNENTIQIVQFHLPEEEYATRKIKIVQDSNYEQGAVSFKGVEIYEANIEGRYKILRADGNTAYIDVYDAKMIKSDVQKIANEASESKTKASIFANQSEESANEASQALEQLNAKAGAIGGYPVLENINGEPKIPSLYINQVDVKEYIEISSETQLSGIPAQVGDVAVLYSVVDGEKTVTKSWILLNESYGNRDWAVFGTSYATNAGNANYAKSANNASTINGLTVNKLSQSAYDNLSDKTGIYFVVIGE